jgi:hypothetical protein
MVINQALTNVVKNIIAQAPLIDTGLLMNSAEVAIYVDDIKGSIDVSIFAQSYLAFHLESTGFMDKFTGSPEFAQELELILSPIIEVKITEAFANGMDFSYEPQITVMFRGL